MAPKRKQSQSNAKTSVETSDLAIWQKRWQALSDTLTSLFDSYKQSKWQAKKEVFAPLMESLRDFANDHFVFFYTRFEKNKLKAQNPESPRYPPEYVLNATLNQVTYDLEALRQAADQRTGSPELSDVLNKADKLAYRALKPAIQSQLLDNLTVVTYFRELMRIRIIPYASVALIGIPFTCPKVETDYLAILHEAGHYLYWHGRFAKVYIYENLQSQVSSDRYSKWLEEIFADVYGCLVGGPDLAIDFQDLQLRSSQSEFVKDDDIHPKPYLRPEIHFRVFDYLGNRKTSERLRERWARKCSKRIPPGSTALKIETQFTELVDQVIEKVAKDYLRDIKGNELGLWWSIKDAENTQPQESFEISTKLLTGISKAEVSRKPQKVQWKEWVGHLFRGGEVPPEEREIEESEWVKVLGARGWATKGPHGDPTH